MEATRRFCACVSNNSRMSWTLDVSTSAERRRSSAPWGGGGGGVGGEEGGGSGYSFARFARLQSRFFPFPRNGRCSRSLRDLRPAGLLCRARADRLRNDLYVGA